MSPTAASKQRGSKVYIVRKDFRPLEHKNVKLSWPYKTFSLWIYSTLNKLLSISYNVEQVWGNFIQHVSHSQLWETAVSKTWWEQ